MLTEQTIRASDRRAQFVGVGAYEQASGGILRDLFEHDDGGWLQNVALLDRLVTEKLAADAETIAKEETELWHALTALDGTAQASLFAHCASFAVNALYEPANRYNQGRVSAHGVRSRLDQADVLARAVGLDMVEAGWRPTVDNYLGRVTKPRILEAVRDAKGESSAQLIDHLKKADMAKEAERLLDGSGWLPEPLRLVDPDVAPVEQEGEAGSLPEFLAEEEGPENA